ncbi:twin-arginine translocase subunit TatC [Nocardioides terrisoli]|uniref:twin-arginine translocase subunit TatC n=1 Tax=Nocardioides terrisoli TaxID=3388267 RepID=UPI00287B9837|nr:twin-arginine translocase subunit TatC [Nocardioides marmorisolisilvae]
MALIDHFRELRARLMRALLALLVAVIAAFFFYHQLLDLITGPFTNAQKMLNPQTQSRIYVSGIGGGLMLQLKLCGVAGLVASSPIWLYQIWAFIMPGLRPTEKRWSLIFVAAAGPLFVAGVGIGYYVLPKALSVLINFTPHGVENLNDFDHFFSFTSRMLLVFGIAFEIPLFVIMLNLAGVVSGKALGRHRPWIIIGTFVFAAVATPSTDPFSMLFLAIPMTALFFVSEIIARIVDSRRGRARAEQPRWSDDEASPLEG